jgi:predicted dehydrogenase
VSPTRRPEGDYRSAQREGSPASLRANPVRLAVVGTGGWARQYHLPALTALRREGVVEVAGLWNRTVAAAEDAARQFEVRRVYRTLDELLDDDRVDGYVVVVHSGAVLAVVSALLARPRPILTEKPPGGSYCEALALADRVGVPNVVGFNRRYMPLNRRFLALASTLPGAYFAGCRFYRHGRSHPRFIGETGIHAINFVECLAGPIRSVRCQPQPRGVVGAAMSPTGRPEGEYRSAQRGGTAASPTGRPEGEYRSAQREAGPVTVAWLEFEAGMTGLIEFLPCSGSNVERYEIHGPASSLYLESPTPYCSDAPGRIVVHEHGRPAAVIAGDDDAGGDLLAAGLIDEYRDFLAAIADPSHVTASNFRNACNTMRIAEAIEAAVAAPGDLQGS